MQPNILCFLDTETTGLDPDLHELWEVAMIRRDVSTGEETEHRWFLPVNLHNADPRSLQISHFYDNYGPAVQTPDFVFEFQQLTKGANLVGAVISFDEERIRRMFVAHHVRPKWHYHLVEVESLVAGSLGIGPPWNSDELSRKVGVEPPSDNERHTAIGDARWVRRMYDAVVKP